MAGAGSHDEPRHLEPRQPGREREARRPSPAPPRAPLGFGLEIEDGQGTLVLNHRALPGLGQLRAFRMRVPDLPFPFEASGDFSNLRSQRCVLQSCEISLTGADLHRYLQRQTQLPLGVRQLSVEFNQDELVIHGRSEIGAHGADFCAMGVVDVAPPRYLRLTVFDIRVFGFLPVSGPALVSALMGSLFGLPQARANERRRVDEGRRSGPTTVTVDVLERVLFDLLPTRGWRLPARDHLALRHQLRPDGRIVLTYAPADGDALGEAHQTSEARRAQWLAETQGQARFEPAEKRLAEGAHDEALERYRKAVALKPNDSFASKRLLQLLCAQKRTLDEAEETASMLLARSPGFPAALLTRAVCACVSGRFAQAASAYEKMASSGEPLPSVGAACALTAAAEMFVEAGDDDGAEELLAPVRRARPAHPRALDVLRGIYLRKKHFPQWLAVLRQRELDASDATSRANLLAEAGQLYWEAMSQPRAALDRFAQAVVLDPETAQHWEGLGRCQKELGMADSARTSFERAMALYQAADESEAAGRVMIGVGDLHQEAEMLEDARVAYEAADALLARPDPSLSEQLAETLVQLGRPSDAVAYLLSAIERAEAVVGDAHARSVTDLRISLATLQSERDKPRARILLKDVLRVEPANPQALEVLARIAGEGDLDDVLVTYRRAINRCEEASQLEAIVTRAKSLAAQAGNDAFVAEALFAAAQSSMPGSGQAARLLGQMVTDEPALVGGTGHFGDLAGVLANHVERPGQLGDRLFAQLCLLLAKIRASAGDSAGALDALDLCLRNQVPDDLAAAAWRQLVELKAAQGDARGAVAALVSSAEDERADQSSRARAALLVTAAEILAQRLDAPGEAEPLLNKAIALDSSNAEAFDALEDLAQAREDWEALADVLSRRARATRLTQRRGQLARLASVLSDKLKRPEAAAQAHERALEVDPDFAVSLLWLARWNWDRAETEASVRYYQRLAAVSHQGGPQSPQYVDRVDTDRLPRRVHGAPDWGAPEALADHVAEAHLRMAQIARALGRLEDVERHLERALEGEPAEGAPLGILVEALDSLGETDRLVQCLRRRAQWPPVAEPLEPGALAPSEPRPVEFELARALERQGHSDEAAAVYEKLLSAFPSHLGILKALCELYRRESRWPELVVAIEKLRSLSESEGTTGLDHISLNIDLANALWQAESDTSRAEAILVETLEQSPANKEAAETLARILLARSDWMRANRVLADAGVVGRDYVPEGLSSAGAAIANEPLQFPPVQAAGPHAEDIEGLVKAAWVRAREPGGEVAAYALLRPVAVERLPPDGLALRGDLAQRMGDVEDLRASFFRWRELTDGGRALRWQAGGLRLAKSAARVPALLDDAAQLLMDMLPGAEPQGEVLDALSSICLLRADFAADAEALSLVVEHIEWLSPGQRAAISLHLARGARLGGDDAAAEDILNRALSLPLDDIDRVRVLVESAKVLADNNETPAAIEELEEALSVFPDDVQALALLGNISFGLHDWPTARRVYARLATRADADTAIRLPVLARRRAELAESFGDTQEAEACYREALRLDSSDLEAWEALARLLLAREEFAGAAACLEHALDEGAVADSAQQQMSMRVTLSATYLQLEAFDKAKDQLGVVLASDPDRIDALELSARLAESEGDTDAEAALWEKLSLLYLQPRQRAEALCRRGDILRASQGWMDAADDAYLRAADVDPTYRPALEFLVHHYWRRCRLTDVAEVSLHALGLEADDQPWSPETRLMAALSVAAGLERPEAADEILASELPDVVQVVGLLCGFAANLADRPAESLDAGLSLLRRALGDDKARMAAIRDAVRQALARAPGQAGALALLGRACEHAGRIEAARVTYGVLEFVQPTSSFSQRLGDLGRRNDPPDSTLELGACLHPLCAGPAWRVLSALAPALAAFEIPDAPAAPHHDEPSLDELYDDRQAADGRIQSLVRESAERLGAPPLLVERGVGTTLELIAGPVTRLAVGPGLVDLEAGELRFYIAVALDQLRSSTFAVERVGRRRFVDLFRGIAAGLGANLDLRKGDDEAFQNGTARFVREAAATGRLALDPSGVTRLKNDALETLEAPPSYEDYVAGCRHTANRVGLLMCGDATLALRALEQVALHQSSSSASDVENEPGQDETRKRALMRQGHPLRELALFALSSQYRDLFVSEPKQDTGHHPDGVERSEASSLSQYRAP